MTKNEKDKIRELRLGGHSYKSISQKLNISENTISSFCRREKLTIQAENRNVCKECGEPLINTNTSKTFCSDKCRYAWWNKHRNMKPKSGNYLIKCKFCGKELDCYGNPNRKYCSHSCYIKDRFHKGGRNEQNIL